MKKKNLHALVIAFAAIGVVAILAIQFRTPTPHPGPTPELDKPALQALPPGDRHLHIALLRVSDARPLTAVLDSVAVPLRENGEINIEVGFRTPKQRRQASRMVLPGPGQSSNSRQASRLLPAGFEEALDFKFRAKAEYFGNDSGLHLLTIRRSRSIVTRRSPGSMTSRSMRLVPEALALRSRTPLARVSRQGDLGVLMMITEGSNAPFNGATRQAWIDAFEAQDLGIVDTGDSTILAAIERQIPKGKKNYEIAKTSSLLNHALGGYLLHQPTWIRAQRAALRADPTKLAALQARTAWKSSRGFLPDGTLHRWLPILRTWLHAPNTTIDPRVSGTIVRRMIQLSDDPEFVRSALPEATKYSPTAGQMRYALEVDPETLKEPQRTAAISFRDEAIRRMEAPWSMVLRSTGSLTAYSALVPILALFVFFICPDPKRRPVQISSLSIFLLAILSFVPIAGFSLKVFAIPIFWSMAWTWLAQPHQPSLRLRAVLWVGLSLMTMDSLQSLNLFFKQPVLDVTLPLGLPLCWIALVGSALCQDERWRRPGRFLWFMWLWAAVNAIGAVLPNMSIETQGTLRVLSNVVFAGSLLSLLALLLGRPGATQPEIASSPEALATPSSSP